MPDATTMSYKIKLLHPSTIHVQVLACVVCLGVGYWWWWWWWSYQHTSKMAVPDTSSNTEHDNGCNNPNCLRCHSSSQHHIQAFQTNVTMLRRLVKLEPALFEGMREEIWSAIDGILEGKLLLVEHQKNDIDQPSGSFVGFKSSLMHQLWNMWQRAATSTSETQFLLSPQQGQNPTVFLLPGLEAIPLHDAIQCLDSCPCSRLWKSIPMSKNSPPITVTGDVETLQRNYHIIRRELLDFLSSNQHSSDPLFKPFDPKVYTRASSTVTTSQGSNNSSTTNKNAHNPEWSSIYLYHQGIRQSEICSKYFPLTTNILETKCPHRMAGKCGLGSVYFSKLERNTKVKEHCGPTNIRWRCHLPLIVPPNNSPEEGSRSCLSVGFPGANEKRVGWKEGVPLLFDDSFLHSAVHHGDRSSSDENNSDSISNGARIVLIVDFWHPGLSDSDRSALGVLYPPGS
mmetsp:Transcript_22035/g.47919  ORF Transcript_22035/g.47919 Transcript_22035/m.47919 type:complete len:455 (+) Transcript_22035:181-1545(+)